MPPAEEPTTTNSLPSCAACSSVLIYVLILRAGALRLDHFRIRFFRLRLVARAQEELAQRVGLLLRRARPLFEAARGPLEVATARARGHATRERHLLFERTHGR